MQMNMRNWLIALNVALLGLILGLALFWHPVPAEVVIPGIETRASPDIPLATAPQGGDFTLDGPRGAMSLQDFRGKVVLLYFGYTYCPDICPTSLVVWQAALASLTAEELARVQPLLVSVDPARDSVARLAEYTTFFHPAIIGLSGTPTVLREIADRYGAVFVRQENVSAGGYVIDHTAVTYVIDPRGRIAATLPHGATAEQLLAAIRTNLSIQ